MDQLCTSGGAAKCRFQDPPFADGRDRYLNHCAAHGARPAALKIKRNKLLWIARHLGAGARLRCWHDGVDGDRAGAAEPTRGGHSCAAGHRYGAAVAAVSRLVPGTSRPFLYRSQLGGYVTWMRDERGFTPSTVEQRSRTARRFLRWCAEAGRPLRDLTAGDIDKYVATQGTRVSTANTVSALHAFLALRRQREVVPEPIGRVDFSARLYQQESLPYAPDWSAV